MRRSLKALRTTFYIDHLVIVTVTRDFPLNQLNFYQYPQVALTVLQGSYKAVPELMTNTHSTLVIQKFWHNIQQEILSEATYRKKIDMMLLKEK